LPFAPFSHIWIDMSRQMGTLNVVSLRHALLGLLAGSPMTGYELNRKFERSMLNVWPAGHSQIYPELARLAEGGKIRQAGSGARGKKIYEITPAGLDEVKAWLRTEPDHASRNPAFLRVFFLWLMEPEEATAFLESEALVHEAKLLEFQEIASRRTRQDDEAWAFGLALEWGIRYEQGILEWNEWARQQIATRTVRRSR
jgi:PadR family transcriptional regulator AphA